MPKIKAAILGATGAVGQRFVQLLDGHSWFEVMALTGSDRTIGQTYEAGCRWILPEPMPEYARRMKIIPTTPGLEAMLCFSALPADTAREIEPAFAQAGHGIASNASALMAGCAVAHFLFPEKKFSAVYAKNNLLFNLLLFYLLISAEFSGDGHGINCNSKDGRMWVKNGC